VLLYNNHFQNAFLLISAKFAISYNKYVGFGRTKYVQRTIFEVDALTSNKCVPVVFQARVVRAVDEHYKFKNALNMKNTKTNTLLRVNIRLDCKTKYHLHVIVRRDAHHVKIYKYKK